MIQAQAPRGWMQIQMSPSRSPGGRSSPSTQVKSATRGGISERLLQRQQPRKNAAVAAAVEDEAGLASWSRRSALEIEDAHRHLVATPARSLRPCGCSGRPRPGVGPRWTGSGRSRPGAPGRSGSVARERRRRSRTARAVSGHPGRGRRSWAGTARATTASSSPASARMSLQRGRSDSPIWNRGKVPASRVMTRWPFRASSDPATLPAGPAPMTRTSASMGEAGCSAERISYHGATERSQPTAAVLRLRRTR